MILEIATLNVQPGEERAFESALGAARHLIEASPGFHRVELRRCVETPTRYLLFVTWGQLEDHTVGFRQGPNYSEWRGRLHHFYDGPPAVEHYHEPVAL
jgi:heme-degrading monooxygenase HmoA